MSTFKLYNGDCLEVLRKCPDNYIDAIVTDPPYGLSFMGKKWDYDVPSVEIWKECLRVLKPGGHLLAFGGTRTYHRLVVAIEDAGFEIRDQIQWIYGQGFPKSMDVEKAIEKEYECQLSFNVNLADVTSAHTLLELREEKTGSVLGNVAIPQGVGQAKLTVIGRVAGSPDPTAMFQCVSEDGTFLNTDTLWSNTSDDRSNPGKKFITETKLRTITGSKILNLLPKLNTLGTICGTGTALKPANEPICLARKPLAESTIAKNVLKYGTGGLNIDACRVSISENDPNHRKPSVGYADGSMFGLGGREGENLNAAGRFPSNVILDEAAAQVLDGQSGVLKSGQIKAGQPQGTNFQQTHTRVAQYDKPADSGGASRFFKTITQDEECSVNTVKLSLNQLNQLGDFVQRLVAISERQDTNLSAILKAFTLAMQNELNKQGESSTITIQSIVERYSHELWLTSMSSSSPASDAEARMLTDTMKIIHGLSTLFSSAEAVTSNTMLKSKELGVPASPNRFAYVAKASKSDRNACVDGSQSKVVNNHSTVKPIKLMEYLCKLVTPPSGVVLDPFMGSGTTGVAALRNGFQFRGIEREEQYFYISQARLEKEQGDAE